MAGANVGISRESVRRAQFIKMHAPDLYEEMVAGTRSTRSIWIEARRRAGLPELAATKTVNMDAPATVLALLVDRHGLPAVEAALVEAVDLLAIVTGEAS